MSAQAWMIWPDNTMLSVLVLLLIAMIFLYAARVPVHGLLRASVMRSAARCAWRRAGCSARRRR